MSGIVAFPTTAQRWGGGGLHPARGQDKQVFLIGPHASYTGRGQETSRSTAETAGFHVEG